MKKITFLLVFISIFGYAQTAITDANIQSAVNTCLATNPVDGMCSDSEYGAMPDWDVSNVTNMVDAFNGASYFNGNLSSWDVSSVTNMTNMFRNANAFNQPIGNWDVSNVTNMSFMFSAFTNGAFNQDINNWDVSSVTTMWYMFAHNSVFNQPIGNWDVNSVTTMELMFYDADDFNQDIGNWDVSNVTNMRAVFWGALSFNQHIGDWDVSNVTTMEQMFTDAFLFNQNIGGWDLSSVALMVDMFNGSGISTDNYDNILIGWSSQALRSNVPFGAVGLNYCNGAAARQSIIDTFGWTITDAGLDCATASIEDEHLFAISIYPNPTSNTLFITGNETPITVSIYNVLGKEVLSIKNTNNINVQALPSGVYVIRISDGVGQTNRKFIKN